jgi:hypothetical protein
MLQTVIALILNFFQTLLFYQMNHFDYVSQQKNLVSQLLILLLFRKIFFWQKYLIMTKYKSKTSDCKKLKLLLHIATRTLSTILLDE